MTDEQDVVAAVLAKLVTATTTPSTPTGQAHTLQDLSKMRTQPDNYLAVNVQRRPTPPDRLYPGMDTVPWRIMVEAVGNTEANARELLRRARSALDFKRVTIGAVESTPFDPQEARQVSEGDTGVWSGLDAWTMRT